MGGQPQRHGVAGDRASDEVIGAARGRAALADPKPKGRLPRDPGGAVLALSPAEFDLITAKTIKATGMTAE